MTFRRAQRRAQERTAAIVPVGAPGLFCLGERMGVRQRRQMQAELLIK